MASPEQNSNDLKDDTEFTKTVQRLLKTPYKPHKDKDDGKKDDKPEKR